MRKYRRIGIIGSRRRDCINDLELVFERFLELYKPGDVIVSGGCPKGGDAFAEIIVEVLGLPDDQFILHEAKWNKYGKAAGFKRNTYIAQDSDIILACVAEDRKGGTEDTIKKYLSLRKEQLHLV